jgi:predicted GNAT superfamily acetyltransferase
MAFAQGYQVVGLQRGNDASYYLIAKREEGASL